MKDLYIIDGYNVINSWELFERLRRESLEHAREEMGRIAGEFAAFCGADCIVAFDAALTEGAETCEKAHGVEMVYTAENETADSFIEKSAQIWARKRRVFVVTSDKAEQDNVLGSGALRISAREFAQIWKKTKKEIEEKRSELQAKVSRMEVAGSLDEDTARRLEALRRKGGGK